MNFREFATNNVYRNIKSYLGYFFSIVLSSTLLFSFNMFINHPDLNILKFPNYLQIGIRLSQSIAYVFLFFFVFYSVSVFLKSRYKEFGILYSLGISKKQIHRMTLIENILINVTASAIGVVVGLIFSKVILMAISVLLELEALRFYIPTKSMILTIVYFTILSGLISVFTSFVVRENQVLRLLKGTRSPKPSPKSSPILVIICILLLGVGYYKAITVTRLNIVGRIIPVTLMVILGTYLLFSQLSVFFIKLIKKNRKFYMKNTTMLCVSNLLYKIKDNTRMFFMITITSTVAFTSIGSVYSFWKDVKRQIETAYPHAIHYATSYEYHNSDKLDDRAKDKERISFLERELKENKISYSRVDGEIKTVIYKKGDWRKKIISESKYRELSTDLGLSPIDIKDGESVALMLEENKKAKHNVVIGNQELTVVKQVEKSIMPAFYKDLYVVTDNFYDNIKSDLIIKDKFTNFNIVDYNNTLSICKDFDKKFSNEPGIQPYVFLSRAVMYEFGKTLYSTVLFLAIFIGLIFFVTSSSFLYNKFYMDCQEDKKKYAQLNKIGLKYKEIKKISTIEIGTLFLLPYIIAVIHSIFALVALKNSFSMEIASSAFFVSASFFLVQIVYFLVIRSSYLKEVRESLNLDL